MTRENVKFPFLGFLLLILVIGLIICFFHFMYNLLITLNPTLAVALITSCTTILIATSSLLLGRYFERIKAVEAELRAQKIKIYDEFLEKLLPTFQENTGGNKNNRIDKLVIFLNDWQRKLMVWSSPIVLNAYIEWKKHLANSPQKAEVIFRMDAFFKAMRKDIGLSNRGLEDGALFHLVLKNSSKILAAAKANPLMTLEQLSEIDK